MSTSRVTLVRRLRALGRNDLLDAIERGVLTAYGAAAAAGIRVRRPVAGTGNSSRTKRRQRELERIFTQGPSAAEMQQELWLGPGPAGSVFSSAEELHAGWLLHREQVMLWWGSNCRRPRGWWRFDAGDLQYPGHELERSCLWRAGRLSEAERVELERFWYREFQRASAPNFMIVKPWPSPPVTGDDARAAHWAWCDLPPELAEAWSEPKEKAPPNG
jgi:hypothetical protein